MMNDKPELELICDSRNGDRDAMTELFRRHYTSSIQVARRILPFRDEYADAVQSAYLSAFLKFNSFRGESSFKTWITKIVMNQCLMRLRGPGKDRAYVCLDDAVTAKANLMCSTPEELASRAETSSALANAAAGLPKPMREVFIRCAVSGFSVQDAATALGLSETAAKSRLFRARLHMRRALKANWNDSRRRSGASTALR